MGCAAIMPYILIFGTCILHHNAAGSDLGIAKTREALEIGIGIGIGIGGGGRSHSPPAPPPEIQGCSPPPPPPQQPPPPTPPIYPFESKRIEIVFPVIQRLRNKIKHDPFGITKTWVGPDICHRYRGFSCHRVPDYKVQALAAVDFNGYNFAGPDLSLTGFIDELPDVSIFHANSNNFTGTIPQKIANLRYLYELDLSNNNLNGQFPSQVLGATKLTFLDLRFNYFSGLVPPQVFELDLDVLFINNNNLIAQKLPDNIGSTPALYLTLANNKFTGPIPSSIGRAPDLGEVLLLNNQLSGCLPSEIGLLRNATVFDVSRNQLTGPIPNSFGCLACMQILNLANNQLYGPVPELVCQLPNLVNLSLSDNYFTEVGPECRKLIQRKVLDAKFNCILGLPMQRSPEECKAFLSKPKSCPNQNSFSWMPCTRNSVQPNSMETANRPSMAPAASPRTYEALIPHLL